MDGRTGAPLNETFQTISNTTYICLNTAPTNSRGIFFGDNPLIHPLPLLLLQLSTISLTTQFTNYCLRHLGQPKIVTQIIGGMILGPSFLGRNKAFKSNLFPERGSTLLQTIAGLGLMFFLFLVGVKMDPGMIKRSGRKVFVIGLSVFFFPFAFPTAIAIILMRFLPMDQTLAESLPFIASSQSLTPFLVIGCLLTELKILNSDLGRLALSSAMLGDVIGMFITAVGFSISQTRNGLMASVCGVVATIGMVAFIVFVIRPALLWVIKQTPEGKSVQELHMFVILATIMVCGFVSESIGQHVVLGPLILGLSIPDGPPLGTALVDKLDSLVMGIFFPTYLAINGLRTDMFSISLQASYIVGFIVIFACLIKAAAAILPSIYYKIPLRESMALGLILNAKGIIEISVYNLWKDDKILKEQEFSLGVISVVLVSWMITPIIRALYDPSERYISSNRRTIQHISRDAELRILICIHKLDNVPTIINLLEVSNATKESPISVFALHLIELLGRTAPVLVAHQPQRTLSSSSSSSSSSDIISKAFRYYEQHNQGFVTVHPFTTISHFTTMHDDICNVALDQTVNIVIVPFHKQWAIDGKVESVSRALGAMNRKIIEKAPCSVGILVDRGILSGKLSVLASRSFYRIVVLFMGGADDVESLYYAVRMAGHKSVILTVLRFLAFGCDSARDRKLDNDMINEFKLNNTDNNRIEFREVVLKDAEGLVSMLGDMKKEYDLMMVGRQQRIQSPLLSGLNEWSECPELGTIGDLLASPDFEGTSSVLVVQQQPRVGGGLINQPMQPLGDVRDATIHDALHEENEASDDASWSISMKRYVSV